jgi:glycerol-3-phosphate dehydrogenase
MYDVAIVGCGIIGAAAAYELSRYRLRTVVLEKRNDVCDATTKANSAIIHAGYDPEPGTLMAKLNVRGAELAQELCARLDVPYRRVGSLVLAFREEERPTLEALYRRGVRNGVKALSLLDASEAHAMEPGIAPDVAGALYAPGAAIVNPWEYGIALAETAVKNGTELRRSSEVLSIGRIDGGWRILTNRGSVDAGFVINAAGVSSDKVHNMVAAPDFTIRPIRGEYYLLDKSEGTRVSHVIFQCPTENGKGVLVSPTVHGNLIAGPNAQAVEDGGDVSNTAQGMDFVRRAALRSVPSISFRDNIRNFAGLRAACERDDFVIRAAAPGFLDLAGIKSPGLTAAPAVAEYALELLRGEGLKTEKKADWDGTRKKIRFRDLSAEEKNRLIRKNPAYGRVICRCETITEGEILDALHSPIPPRSIDGVKRRAGSGMGRCQGGFCGPRVLAILAREYHMAPEEIPQDNDGSWILSGETKRGGSADA